MYMKRIVASVGLAALGAAGFQTAQAADASKPWNVSATLRGFYDDNPNTVPSGTAATGSFGFEINPSLGLGWNLEQTSISLMYAFSGKYYEQAFANTLNQHWDFAHTFNGIFSHTFSERYQMSVDDSFVVGQEPDTLRVPNQGQAQFQYISGNNIRNYGTIKFDAQITPLLGVEVGYANAFYDYADSFSTLANPPGTAITPSNSGQLNRVENTPRIDTRWQLQPDTVGIVGFAFSQVDYTGDEPIAGINGDPATYIMSDSRNNRSYIGYVGAEHTFRPDFTATARIGAQYADFYNAPNAEGSSKTDTSPYALATVRYTYAAGSYLEGGFSYGRNASDLVGTSTNGITLDAQSAVVYASLNHRITPKLHGSLVAQFQDSTYYGGIYNNKTDLYYTVGLDFQYYFTPHFSAELGYNYDKLDSEVGGRSFDRNRVYTGVTASF
jgi:Putative beta-barrel porin 2